MGCYWITGASSGIGKALSLQYALPGNTLGLVGLSEKKLETVERECKNKGALVNTYVADVGNALALREATRDFLDKVSFVDVVIANAGIRAEENEDYDNDQLPVDLMRTNFIGVINTFAPFIPIMRSKRHGHLVAISSIAAYRGTQNSGLYSASKAAINIWAESLRLRMASFNVHVSVMCAGFVDTEMTRDITFDMPGLLTAEQAAREIDYGIQKEKRIHTFPWQSRLIWGLLKIIPGSVYDFLIAYAKKIHPKRR